MEQINRIGMDTIALLIGRIFECQSSLARFVMHDHRQREPENGAFWRICGAADITAVALDDCLAKRQANTHAKCLGGDKRREQPIGNF